MSRTTPARLMAALIGTWALPALAQSAPMGAPSDMAPPAPLQSTAVSDTRPAKDSPAPKLVKARHTGRSRAATHKTSVDTAASGSGQVKS